MFRTDMYFIIEDYYDQDEVYDIHQELESLKRVLLPPEKTGTAVSITGTPKKENKGLFLDEYYKDNRSKSVILSLNRKTFSEQVENKLSQFHWFYNYMKDTKHDTTLVSYYRQGDYYKSHTDKSFITAIYYTWTEPKPFKGGELYIENELVPIKNNCLVVFPSKMKHRVSEITEGEGRWAISQFISLELPSTPQRIVPVDTFENFLSVPEFNHVSSTLSKSDKWSFSGTSGSGSIGKFWYIDLINDPYFTSTLFERIKKIVKLDLKLIRVYANGQNFGQNGDFHQDSKEPNSFTFLLYLNEILDSELDLWGGETQFRKEDFKVLSYQPRTNRGLFFPSVLWHRGLGPSRYVNVMRITIAWKMIL